MPLVISDIGIHDIPKTHGGRTRRAKKSKRRTKRIQKRVKTVKRSRKY